MTSTPVRSVAATAVAGHLLCLAFIASQTGCDSRAAEAANPRPAGTPVPAPRWTLAASPLVSIGRTEGDDAYLLHDVEGALRLENGDIVVLNTGTQELKFYGSAGEHIRTVGGKGDGPGEFRRPARLYRLAGDTLAVFDRANETMSRFDRNGAFIDAVKSPAPEGEKFARDAWLYRRNFVDGPMTPADRPPVRLILDRLPPLPDGAAFRYVRVDRLGRLWVRNEPAPAETVDEWHVYGTDGSILGRLETPRGFDLMQTERDFVLGRAYDGMNVEHIVLYSLDTGDGQPAGMLEATPGSDALPGGPDAAPDAGTPAQPTEEVLRQMRSVLRNGMAAQEIYYSKPEHGYRYASRADDLTWPEDMPEGLDVHILGAGQFGWTMIVSFGAEPVLCGAMVGFTGPIGWKPGTVVCGD